MNNKSKIYPGYRMADGCIYAGRSPETGEDMFATAADVEPQAYDKAEASAKSHSAHGHNDWRLPTKDELSVLFNNKAKIGGFAEREYWANSWSDRYSHTHDFGDGKSKIGYNPNPRASRFIRRGQHF